jgi:hypothetical protein
LVLANRQNKNWTKIVLIFTETMISWVTLVNPRGTLTRGWESLVLTVWFLGDKILSYIFFICIWLSGQQIKVF